MRLVDADALREKLAYRFFDITGVPATAVVDETPTAADADLAAMTKSRDRADNRWYEAESARKQVTKDRDHEHNKLMDTARDLAAAREEARKWHDRWDEICTAVEENVVPLNKRIDDILARYQPGGES